MKRKRKMKRFKRNCKRTLYNILIAPTRLPRLSDATFRVATYICEVSGAFSALALLFSLVYAVTLAKIIFIGTAIIFVAFLIVIQLQVYQDILEARGYNISRRAF